MTKQKIYGMALDELYRRIEAEEAQRLGPIRTARLKILREEMRELLEMALEAERKAE